MAIHYYDRERIFCLQNEKVSFLLWRDPFDHLQQLYFGAPVDICDLGEIVPQRGNVHTVRWNMENGEICDPTLQPYCVHTLWSGDFNEPSLCVALPGGDRRLDLAFTGFEIFAEKKKIPGMPCCRGGEALLVKLGAKGIQVELTYSIFPDTAAVQCSMSVKNTLTQPVRLERAFSYALHLPAGKWDVLTLPGYTRHERLVERTELAHGSFSIDSRRGLSSAMVNPFMAVMDHNAEERWGTVYGLNLIYSGSFRMIAERCPNETLRLTGGIQDNDFAWKLEPGETFSTPEAILCYSGTGLETMTHELHDLYRKHILPPQFAFTHHPVVMNNWEGTRFACTPDRIYPIIDAAAGRGIDTFVLDDGWFGKREDAVSGLGDWVVNEEKIGGLQNLIDHVHEKGMKFGLWFEPEMVNEDSDLYRAHPDWALKTPSDVPLLGRNQMMLDLTNPVVRDYVVQAVNNILDTYAIDYVKWDCNRDMSEGYAPSLPEDRQQETTHRYVLGLYDLCERIVAAHPGIRFEGCASGGSRYDGGILYYFPAIWASDNADVYGRERIQYGTSICYPLSTISCHVASSPGRNGTHKVPWATRAALAQFGATGYEMDLSKASSEELAGIPAETEEYRRCEDMMLGGKFYRLLSPFDSNYLGMEMVSEDKKQAKLLLILEIFSLKEPYPRVFPRGLEENTVYLVPELGQKRTGRTWMQYGILPDFPPEDFSATVYHFTAM